MRIVSTETAGTCGSMTATYDSCGSVPNKCYMTLYHCHDLLLIKYVYFCCCSVIIRIFQQVCPVILKASTHNENYLNRKLDTFCMDILVYTLFIIMN